MQLRPRIVGLSLTLLSLLASSGAAPAAERWFEEVKARATPSQLYTFLYALPKGGDLHNHLGGSARSDWLWAAALAQQDKGYTYYTKVRIENCAGFGTDEFGRDPYLLLFKNLQASDYEKLDSCQKSEYKRLQDLNEPEHAAWLNSLRLDTPHEGRDEFFEAQWRRIDALLATGGNVLLFRQRELYHMTALVNRYTTAPVRFVVGLSLIIRAFEDPYGNLEGNRLEALARLFAQNVRIYAYPMTVADLRESLDTASTSGWEWSEKDGWVSAAQLRRAGPLGHLFAYLLASNFIVPMPVPAALTADA